MLVVDGEAVTAADCARGIATEQRAWNSAFALFNSACLASDDRLTCTLADLPVETFSSRSATPSAFNVSIWAASVVQAGSIFATGCGATDAVASEGPPVLEHAARPAAISSEAIIFTVARVFIRRPPSA